MTEQPKVSDDYGPPCQRCHGTMLDGRCTNCQRYETIPQGLSCYTLPVRKGYMLQVRTKTGWVDALQNIVGSYADLLHFDTSHDAVRIVRRSIEDVVLA